MEQLVLQVKNHSSMIVFITKGVWLSNATYSNLQILDHLHLLSYHAYRHTQIHMQHNTQTHRELRRVFNMFV